MTKKRKSRRVCQWFAKTPHRGDSGKNQPDTVCAGMLQSMLGRGTSAVGMLRRLQSTSAIAQGKAAMPGNLQLADGGRILRSDPQTPRIEIPEEQYYFPPLHAAVSSLPVKEWKVPGKVTMREQAGGKPSIENYFPLRPLVWNNAIRRDLVHEVIRQQRARLRQPHRTKRVGEISGSTRKPHPQKGGGRSQAGNTRNSTWRGGMKAHGPVLRSFDFDLNRKYRALAMMAVLTAKHREGNLHIFDKFTLDTIKTKDLMKVMRSHGLMSPPNPEKLGKLATPAASIKLEDDEEPIHIGRKWRVMFVCNNIDLNLVYAAKNVQELIVVPETSLKLLDLIRFDVLCVSEASIQRLQMRLESQYRTRTRIVKMMRQAEIMATHGVSEMIDLKKQRNQRAVLRQEWLAAEAEAAAEAKAKQQ